MEILDTNLEKYILENKNLSIEVKINFMIDISDGI